MNAQPKPSHRAALAHMLTDPRFLTEVRSETRTHLAMALAARMLHCARMTYPFVDRPLDQLYPPSYLPDLHSALRAVKQASEDLDWLILVHQAAALARLRCTVCAASYNGVSTWQFTFTHA